jgi:hypothetical protein
LTTDFRALLLTNPARPISGREFCLRHGCGKMSLT